MDRVGVVVEGVRDLAVAGTRTPGAVEREVVPYRDEELVVVGVVRRADDVVRVVRFPSDVPPDAAGVGSTPNSLAGVSSAASPDAE